MKQDGRATRTRLLRAAGRLFARRGFDGVSVRDIARAAGANLGAVTYHFGGKEALFAEVIAEKARSLRDIWAAAVASDLPPRGKLERMLRESALLILHRDPSLKAFFAESLHGGRRLPKDAVASLEERNRAIAAIIRQGVADGDFRPCDPACATWVFTGLLMPYMLHEPLINPKYRRGPYPEAFVRHIVDTALDLFFRGLERRS